MIVFQSVSLTSVCLKIVVLVLHIFAKGNPGEGSGTFQSVSLTSVCFGVVHFAFPHPFP